MAGLGAMLLLVLPPPPLLLLLLAVLGFVGPALGPGDAALLEAPKALPPVGLGPAAAAGAAPAAGTAARPAAALRAGEGLAERG